jgi:biotin carboxyl carrier protein
MKENKEGRLTIDHTSYSTNISRRFAERKPYSPSEPGRIMSFIPGTITEVFVTEGDEVQAGDEVVILDAMKMKNRLKSHISGRVLSVNVKPGDRVAKGTVLVEIS